MHDMFDVLYDDIFINSSDNNNINDERENKFDNEKNSADIIAKYNKYSEVINKYLKSGARPEEKTFIVALRRYYVKIQVIENYEEVQKKLYSNMSSDEIIRFELERIFRHKDKNNRLMEQANDINRLLTVIYNTQIPEELYNKIIHLIIKIEILLGIRIGLFRELCSFYESEMQRISQQVNLPNEGISYTKKM